MAEPLACPRCASILTDDEVKTLHKRYASAQRKTKAGGRNGGRPPKAALGTATKLQLEGADGETQEIVNIRDLTRDEARAIVETAIEADNELTGERNLVPFEEI